MGKDNGGVRRGPAFKCPRCGEQRRLARMFAFHRTNKQYQRVIAVRCPCGHTWESTHRAASLLATPSPTSP